MSRSIQRIIACIAMLWGTVGWTQSTETPYETDLHVQVELGVGAEARNLDTGVAGTAQIDVSNARGTGITLQAATGARNHELGATLRGPAILRSDGQYTQFGIQAEHDRHSSVLRNRVGISIDQGKIETASSAGDPTVVTWFPHVGQIQMPNEEGTRRVVGIDRQIVRHLGILEDLKNQGELFQSVGIELVEGDDVLFGGAILEFRAGGRMATSRLVAGTDDRLRLEASIAGRAAFIDGHAPNISILPRATLNYRLAN